MQRWITEPVVVETTQFNEINIEEIVRLDKVSGLTMAYYL